MVILKGGEKMKAALDEMARKLSSPATLKVGFLEGSTYPNGTPVAYVAAINEFGATIDVGAHQTTIFRNINKEGDFLNGGRFVRADKANFASDHDVAAYSIKIPSRPFFRNMIADRSSAWPGQLASILKATDYDVVDSLKKFGKMVSEQLQQSILSTKTPPNAPSTIRGKGFDNPLINTSHMLNSVDYEVDLT